MFFPVVTAFLDMVKKGFVKGLLQKMNMQLLYGPNMRGKKK